MNEFNIGIGARKAKKLGVSMPAEQFVEPSPALETKRLIELRNDLETAQTSALVAPTISDRTVPSADVGLSKDQIILLAQKHGLKFEGMKKEFVKHTYSVTLDAKTLFKKYCDTLGLNMQDAMDEALQDFFKKHALEYNRVKEAKRS